MRVNSTQSPQETCTGLPFGDMQSCTGTDESPMHYTGQQWDSEDNLTAFWFRTDSTTQGRWGSMDPAGLAAVDPTNPQTWNRYAYVTNNPISFIDPLGLYIANPCYNDPTCGGDGGPGGDPCLNCGSGPLLPVTPPGGTGGGGGSGGKQPTCGVVPLRRCAAANNGKSICSGAAGKTIPVNAPFGQMRFQFNGSGNLIGLGVQLTGMNGVQGNGLSIPANTFAGFTQLSPGTVQFGFSNPVQVGSGVSQAYFQTATFSGGSFTSVQGAYAPLGIPLGSSSGNSSLLQWALNGQLPFTSSLGSAAQNFGNTLSSLASLVSSNVSCKDVFGGG